jgi:hypothetical protein
MTMTEEVVVKTYRANRIPNIFIVMSIDNKSKDPTIKTLC